MRSGTRRDEVATDEPSGGRFERAGSDEPKGKRPNQRASRTRTRHKESGAERVGAASDHFEIRLAPWYQPGHPHVWSVNQESVLKALCNRGGFPPLARIPSSLASPTRGWGEWQGMRACAQNDSHPPLLHLLDVGAEAYVAETTPSAKLSMNFTWGPAGAG